LLYSQRNRNCIDLLFRPIITLTRPTTSCSLSSFFLSFLCVCSVFRRISSRSSVPPELQGPYCRQSSCFHFTARVENTKRLAGLLLLSKLCLSGVTTLLSCLSDYRTTKIIIKRQGGFPLAMVMGRIDRCRKIPVK